MSNRWRMGLIASLAVAQAQAAPAPRSGFEFLTPDLRALQQDEFANPGMFWVEHGERLWNERSGDTPSCASCHAADRMRGVAARYPAFDRVAARVLNLEQRINRCRTEQQRQPAFEYESQRLLAMTVWLTYQSRDQAVAVRIDGPAAASYARGREQFYLRRGQLDLACSSCHEQYVGARLRGEQISQGQINGFPVYRQLWQSPASTHRMFAWCNDSVRAAPYALGSQEYVDLELFVKARGNGLSVESPAIRK